MWVQVGDPGGGGGGGGGVYKLSSNTLDVCCLLCVCACVRVCE